MDLPYKGRIKNKSLYNQGKAGGKTGLGVPRGACELPRNISLGHTGCHISMPLKNSRYKASLGMDGSTPPKPGCQVSLLHPGKNEGSHGELYLPVSAWHPPGDAGRRDTVFYLDSSTLYWEIVWKGTMENGINTSKDFLCWLVPVGILTEKDKHVAEEPPKHLYSKKLHLYLIHRKITYFV